MEQLFFSLNATIPIFLVMVIGYILKRIGLLDEDHLFEFRHPDRLGIHPAQHGADLTI